MEMHWLINTEITRVMLFRVYAIAFQVAASWKVAVIRKHTEWNSIKISAHQAQSWMCAFVVMYLFQFIQQLVQRKRVLLRMKMHSHLHCILIPFSEIITCAIDAERKVIWNSHECYAWGWWTHSLCVLDRAQKQNHFENFSLPEL